MYLRKIIETEQLLVDGWCGFRFDLSFSWDRDEYLISFEFNNNFKFLAIVQVSYCMIKAV